MVGDELTEARGRSVTCANAPKRDADTRADRKHQKIAELLTSGTTKGVFMFDYAQKRAEAAKWMPDNKQEGHWWRWHVLRKKNPNNNPELSDHDASLIFADFIQAGVLLPVIASDGQGAHAIHEGKSTEWDAAARRWR